MGAASEGPESDEQLVLRFQGGDEAAFDAIVLRHRKRIYRVAFRLMGSHPDADDLSQETFLRAYRGLGRYRGEALLSTWLTRIAVNLALNVRRARPPSVPLEDAAGREVDGSAVEASLRGQIRRAVGTLPPRQRQVLMLRVYEGLKFIEIARSAGMSIGTAKATFFQAVRGLRHRLASAPAGADGDEEAGT